MSGPITEPNRRILVIDDNAAIHEDFRKILCPANPAKNLLRQTEATLFGTEVDGVEPIRFSVAFAFQGEEGLTKVQQALSANQPYAVAFVDVRMPPGWNGIETVMRLWQVDPALQVVICTAYSDYSWDAITKALGLSDSLVILKKPFDVIEVSQLAHALSKKWWLAQQGKLKLQDLDQMVQQRTQELHQELATRRQAEAALRLSEERFEKAFCANPIAMAIQTFNEERYVDVNQSFLELTHLSRETVVGYTPTELPVIFSDETQSTRRQMLERHQRVTNLRCRLTPAAGPSRDTLLWVELFNLGPQPLMLVLVQDISERLSLENQLRQAQKIEAVGQLAAGVAHDFNNLLTIIQGHVSLRLSDAGLSADMRDSLQEITAASERAARLTRQLLAFGRKQVMSRAALDLHQLVLQSRHMMSRVVGEDIELICECPSALPSVQADAGHLHQVIMNLILNARDAMAEGGTLTLHLAALTLDSEYARSHPEGRPGQFVCLSVADTGSGMDSATQAHIFEPFFTTKDVGRGSGMGLAMVYGIVKQHEGWIEVSSQPQRGSVFRVFLPTSHDPAPPPEEPTLSPSWLKPTTLQGSERILVVEDELQLRELVRTVLQKHGYRIMVASDGVEALKLWQEQNGSFDLLLTDLVMPNGMSGRRLAERLVAEKPHLKVIFTSGYNEEMQARPDDEQKGSFFLAKPYESARLLKMVRACLLR